MSDSKEETTVASRAKIIAFPRWPKLQGILATWGVQEERKRFDKRQRMFVVASVGDGVLMYFPINAKVYSQLKRQEGNGQMLAEQAAAIVGEVPAQDFTMWQTDPVKAYKIATELTG